MINFSTTSFINRIINRLMFKSSTITLFLLIFVCKLVIADTEAKKLVYQLNIRDEITPGMARKVNKAISLAEEKHADIILIHMNTYGGLLDAADSIRTKILNCKIPSIVFIDHNAASAGALIAIACNKIYMREGGSIGAATVVDQTAKALPDKYQSYMRSMMRSTAEARKRDPRIAEAMVDPRIYIAGVNDSGKVLTLTSSEALKNNYCNGIAESITQVLQKENLKNYSLEVYQPTWVENLIGFLINPAVSGVLILVMLGGLYFEMQHPGIGFPLIAAILAGILYFAPLYLEGLAENWEVLLTVAGLLLILTEIFVIPGFGVAGISGIILMVTGLTVSMLNNDGFNFSGVTTQKIFASMAIVMGAMVGALIMFIATGKSLAKTPAFRKMVLQTTMDSGSGYVSMEHGQSSLVGMKGKTLTVLRPSGKIIIGGKVYFASAESGFITIDEEVIVVSQQMSNLMVRKI